MARAWALHDRKRPNRPFYRETLSFGHSAKMRVLSKALVAACAIITLSCCEVSSETLRAKRGVVPGNAASRPKGMYVIYYYNYSSIIIIIINNYINCCCDSAPYR